MLEVFPRQLNGVRGDVYAVNMQVGSCPVKEGVQQEGDAACACAKVQDVERWRGFGSEAGVVPDEGCQVGGVGFRLWPF